MGDSQARLWPHRARRVREDWVAWLPAEKDGLFEATVNELEVFYWMLSVTLDEALSLRDTRTLVHARVQAGVSADLFDRLAARLLAALGALEEHGRHFGTLSNVVPLNPDFFRGETAQRMARRSSLLSRVLLSSRSKFFHKLRALAEMVEDLREEFREAAEELAEGISVQPGAHWQALDTLHYDLNTCLRETIVVLKSFLCALPDEEVQPFQRKLRARAQAAPQTARTPAPAVRHRRVSLF